MLIQSASSYRRFWICVFSGHFEVQCHAQSGMSQVHRARSAMHWACVSALQSGLRLRCDGDALDLFCGISPVKSELAAQPWLQK